MQKNQQAMVQAGQQSAQPAYARRCPVVTLTEKRITSARGIALPSWRPSPTVAILLTLCSVYLEALCCVAVRPLLCCFEVAEHYVCPRGIQLAAAQHGTAQHVTPRVSNCLER